MNPIQEMKEWCGDRTARVLKKLTESRGLKPVFFCNGMLITVSGDGLVVYEINPIEDPTQDQMFEKMIECCTDVEVAGVPDGVNYITFGIIRTYDVTEDSNGHYMLARIMTYGDVDEIGGEK